MASAKTHKSKTKKRMQKLGIYKAEFDPVIEVYADLKEQYDVLTSQFITNDYSFEVETNSGSKKAPIVTTLESLRKDILTYARDLGLTPHGLLKFDETAFTKQTNSKFDKIMSGLISDD